MTSVMSCEAHDGLTQKRSASEAQTGTPEIRSVTDWPEGEAAPDFGSNLCAPFCSVILTEKLF